MPRPAHVLAASWRLPAGDGPLRHRVADAVVAQIRAGALAAGDVLPPTRVLAAELGVSRSVVLAAYDEVQAAGFVVSRAGSGTRVAPDAAQAAAAGATSHVGAPTPAVGHATPPTAVSPRWDLRSGRPDVSLIDPVAWRRAWRARPDALPGLGEYEPDNPALRRGLSAYLRRTRGIVADPDGIVIVPGIAASLDVLCEVLGLSGAAMAFEDPGYVEAVPLLRSSGVRLRPVPVDDDGLDPALLRGSDRSVYVTPSHQYPLGGRMPVGRRAALIDWAHRQDAIIIEDDYDGEFRYDVAPLPALHTLPGAPERVVFLGTASKLLAPGIRVAWIVPPRRFVAPLRRAAVQHSLVVNAPTLAALAQLLSSGALIAHQARAARTYAARRAAIVAGLRRHTPDVDLAGVDAGLHLVIRLPDRLDDAGLVDRLRHQGIGVRPLSAFCLDSPARGLVLGYSRLPETQADQVAQVISRALR